ncbi:MAG: glyoxalase [Hydrogenophaga sp.]|nr:glyoxalase [Hydrogenophaga sp.]
MGVERIDHVQLPFAGPLQAQLRHFYGRLLGLSEVRLDATQTLRFVAGTQRIDLAPSEWNARLSAPGHLALHVRNLPGLRANLLDAGLAIDETHPLPGHWRLYVDDPAGNTVELLEPAHEPGAHA